MRSDLGLAEAKSARANRSKCEEGVDAEEQLGYEAHADIGDEEGNNWR